MKLHRESLQLARARHGWSIGKTADEAGISNNSVLRAEHEEEVSVGTVHKLAVALKVDVSELVGEPALAGKAEAPEAGPADQERRARVEGWADYVRWRAGKIEREIEEKIPDPDSSQTYEGEKIYLWSSAWNLERRAYNDYSGKLKPSPGDEAMMIEGALARLGQVLKAGEARAEARGEAWNHALDDLHAEQPARPGIGGE